MVRWAWSSILISHKLESLFGNLSEGLVFEKTIKPAEEGHHFFSLFEGEKTVLAANRDHDANIKMKSWPVLLDSETLKQTELLNMKENPHLNHLVEGVGLKGFALPTKVGHNSVLFVNKNYFSLIDFEENKVLDSIIYTPGEVYMGNSLVNDPKIGPYRFWSSTDYLMMLKTAQMDGGMKKVEILQKIHLPDYFLRTSHLSFAAEFSMLQLKSGNWLFVGGKSMINHPKEEQELFSSKSLKVLSMEIFPKTLTVLNTRAMRESQCKFTTKTIDLSKFFLALEDLLVAAIGLEESEHEDSSPPYGLGLWDKELNLLDKVSAWDFDLQDLNCIKVIDRGKVVARCSRTNYALFKIDSVEKKIIPIKILTIWSMKIIDINENNPEARTVCFKARKQDNKEIWVRINSSLELVSWTENFRMNEKAD